MAQDDNKPEVMEELPPPSDNYIARAEAKSLEFMNPKRWQVMEYMARTFVQSGALPASVNNAPRLVMVFQAGYEAGMQPIEALNSFYFVNGKLSLYGDMAITQAIKAGHKVEWGKCDDKTATVTITRGDTGKSMKGTFTMEMAEKRGLTKNPVYKTSPANMLKFKAFGSIAKFIVPDGLHGIPIKEDLESDIIEPAKAQPEKTLTAPAATTTQPSLAEALEPEADKEETTQDGK